MIMKRLTREECPNTRTEFIKKWNSDHIFRAKAQQMGFEVVFDNVIFPNRQFVADSKVR